MVRLKNRNVNPMAKSTPEEVLEWIAAHAAEAGDEDILLRITCQLYDYESRYYVGDKVSGIIMRIGTPEQVTDFRGLLAKFVQQVTKYGIRPVREALEDVGKPPNKALHEALAQLDSFLGDQPEHDQGDIRIFDAAEQLHTLIGMETPGKRR